MLKFRQVQQVALTADELVRGLLKLSETEHVSILDSCGVGHLGSHLLIAGIDPLAVQEHDSIDGEASLAKLQSAVDSRAACIFTISYDLGRKLQGLTRGLEISREPDAFIALRRTYRARLRYRRDTDRRESQSLASDRGKALCCHGPAALRRRLSAPGRRLLMSF